MIATLGGIGFLQPGYDTQQVNVPGIRRTVESDWFPLPEQPTPVAVCHSQTSSGSTTTSDLIIALVNAATLLPLLLKVVHTSAAVARTCRLFAILDLTSIAILA